VSTGDYRQSEHDMYFLESSDDESTFTQSELDAAKAPLEAEIKRLRDGIAMWVKRWNDGPYDTCWRERECCATQLESLLTEPKERER